MGPTVRKARGVALALVATPLLLSAGCLPDRGVGFGTVLGYEGLQHDIRRYYAARAWERNAVCNTPEIDAILSARVIEETDDRIVAVIRYSWADESKIDDGDGLVTFGGAGSCAGIDDRRFTLAKQSDGTVSVVAMSGAQRPS
jgi:hypothetical protein